MKTSIEGLIYHFKIFTEGFAPPPGEVYQSDRIAARRTGRFHGQRRFGEAVPRELPHAVVCEPAIVAETLRRHV